MDQEQNPFIQKILDYAKGKPGITYDEISDLVGPDFVNSPAMEEVLGLLAQQHVEIIESGLVDEDEQDDVVADDEDDVADEALLDDGDDVVEDEDAEKIPDVRGKLVNGDKQ